jgi:CHASE3 domain sensor protein
MSIRAKVLLPLAGVILFALVASGLGMLQLARVQDELEAVVEYDWPLVRALTQIALEQHDQAVQFERAVHYGERQAFDSAAASAYRSARTEFDWLANASARSIDKAQQLASPVKLRDEHVRTKFESALEVLGTLEAEHSRYVHDAAEVFAQLDRGQIEEALNREGPLQGRADALHHKIDGLLSELEAFTREGSERARQDEKNAVYSVGIFTAVCILLVMLAGSYILHFVGQPKLHGQLLPICSSCKKIRDEDGAWNSVDTYAMERTEPTFMDSLCPNCRERLE